MQPTSTYRDLFSRAACDQLLEDVAAELIPELGARVKAQGNALFDIFRSYVAVTPQNPGETPEELMAQRLEAIAAGRESVYTVQHPGEKLLPVDLLIQRLVSLRQAEDLRARVAAPALALVA